MQQEVFQYARGLNPGSEVLSFAEHQSGMVYGPAMNAVGAEHYGPSGARMPEVDDDGPEGIDPDFMKMFSACMRHYTASQSGRTPGDPSQYPTNQPTGRTVAAAENRQGRNPGAGVGEVKALVADEQGAYDRQLELARNYAREGYSWDDAMMMATAPGVVEAYDRRQEQLRDVEDDEVVALDRHLSLSRQYERQGLSWADAQRRATTETGYNRGA